MARRIWFILLCCLPGCPGGQDGSPPGPPAPVGVPPFALGTPDLVLLITGGGNGMMEVCNCSGPMPGGLARRSGLVLSYRSAFPSTFVLDAGDAFWITGDDVRNEYLLHAYRQIGYDSLVLGDQEWSASPARLRKMLSPGPMEYLSTTVGLALSSVERAAATSSAPASSQAVEGGQAPLARAVKRDFGSVKLAVLCDLPRRSLLFLPNEQLRAMTFAGPEELARQARELHRDGYVVVVVCHGDDEALKVTADACLSAAGGGSCPVDLFIRGHAAKPARELLTVAGRPVVKVGGSEYVTALAMKLGPDGRIGGLEQRLEVVDQRWPIDGRLIRTYQAYCGVAMREALGAARKKGLDYVPSDQCGKCHLAQYQRWAKTEHAGAYEPLVKVKRTGDPSCLTCHTTGFGTENGFHTLQETPKLAGVNCQDCHRFDMSRHSPGSAFRPPRPAQDTCQTCHTPVTDPRFDFSAKLPKVACPSTRPAGPVVPRRP